MNLKKEFKKNFSVKTDVIYNPLNKKEIIKKSKLVRKNSSYFLKKNLLKIINIGRLTDQKDHLTIIKSLKLIMKKLILECLLLDMEQKRFFEKKN